MGKGKAPKVLLADDKRELCMTIKGLLEDALSARVDVAFNGDQAIDQLLKAQHPGEAAYDLLILDMRMPRGSDEDEALEQHWALDFLLEQQRAYLLLPAGTPVIVFTQYPSYKDCVRCIRDGGAVDYIPKQDVEINNQYLIDRCREILTSMADPDDVWLNDHFTEFASRHTGQVLSIIDETVARKANVAGETIAGRVLLEGASFEELRDRMLGDKLLRWVRPFIIRVPEGESLPK